MNRVVQILMNRDGMTETEAREAVQDCVDMMEEAIQEGNYLEAEDIFMDELGLEPDYIFDVIM